MNPWAYARFWEMQLRQSWAVSESPPRNPIFTRERHYIATVAFAEFAGADELYLSMIWGGLRGGAERIAVRDGQVVHIRALWIA